MATKILMEALSPTMEEGRLVEWKKREGDAVAAGDVLAEVETDKAVMELVARASGTLLKQLVPAGSTVPVASPVGWIGQPGEAIADGQAAGRSEAQVAATPAATPVAVPAPAVAPAPAASPETGGRADGPTAGGRVKASPLARKLASDRGLDLAAIAGSGPEGRVVKRDVESAPTDLPVRPSARPPVSPSPRLPA